MYSKAVKDEKGFLTIHMDWDTARSLGFGVPALGGCICMICNDVMGDDDDIIYVAVLGDVMCKECYDEFVKDTPHYDEDMDIELRNFIAVADSLNINVEDIIKLN